MVKDLIGKEGNIKLDKITPYEVRLIMAGTFLINLDKGMLKESALTEAEEETRRIIRDY